jgi:TolA-binding protein
VKTLLCIILFVFSLTLSGCSGNRAAELYDTAQFEEKQNNMEHAAQLYEEIIKKYPESEQAKKAAERLKTVRHP